MISTKDVNPPDIAELDDQLNAAERDADQLTAGIDEKTGTFRSGGWSVAECLDHLAVTNRVYLGAMKEPAMSARRDGKVRRGPARPGVFGRWFVASLEPPIRLRFKAPKMIEPGPSPSLANALAAFRSSQNEVHRFLEASADLDLPGVYFANPFLNGIRVSVATGLNVILAHERRHLWQAWRARKAAESSLR